MEEWSRDQLAQNALACLVVVLGEPGLEGVDPSEIQRQFKAFLQRGFQVLESDPIRDMLVYRPCREVVTLAFLGGVRARNETSFTRRASIDA